MGTRPPGCTGAAGRDSGMTSARLPEVRGSIIRGAPLAPLTWFRVGGPADVLFLPADEDDLASFLQKLDLGVPVTPVGVGSNLLVRDGGVRGVTIRLGSRLGRIEILGDAMIRAGAAALAARVAESAAHAGIAGLEFLSGIPGTIGGVLAMNAGCYGSTVSEILSSADALDRGGGRVRLLPAEMGFSYRHCSAAEGRIFLGAELRGRADSPDAVRDRMRSLLGRREASQPIRCRTGGSTFRNPGGRPGAGSDSGDLRESAWRLIDAAGCRGLERGGASVSEQHANFLINRGDATAAELESLGEDIRRRVFSCTGIRLTWEIRRIGESVGND